MISFENVTKRYKKFTALDNISLTIEPGVTALLSPNGAGKTTMMQLLTTVLFPTEGTILYNGEDINKLGAGYRARLSYLPQNMGYYPNWTPVEYISYIAELRGIDSKKAKNEILEKLELFGLGDVAKKKMKTFSGGMLRRVGLAQTLIGDADIYIYDEPTAGLDPIECARFKEIIADFPSEKTVLISTHIISDVSFISNKVLMLKDKKVLLNEPAQALCDSLRGKIFEARTANDALSALSGKADILQKRAEYDSLYVRYLKKETEDQEMSLCGGETAVEPSLTDVFLHYYKPSEKDVVAL